MKSNNIINFKNADKLISFVKDLINTFGYEFQISSRYMAEKLGNISYITAIKYLSILERDGYLNVERPSRRQGNIYILKKGQVKRLFEDYKADKEIQELFKNGFDFDECKNNNTNGYI